MHSRTEQSLSSRLLLQMFLRRYQSAHRATSSRCSRPCRQNAVRICEATTSWHYAASVKRRASVAWLYTMHRPESLRFCRNAIRLPGFRNASALRPHLDENERVVPANLDPKAEELVHSVGQAIAHDPHACGRAIVEAAGCYWESSAFTAKQVTAVSPTSRSRWCKISQTRQ